VGELGKLGLLLTRLNLQNGKIPLRPSGRQPRFGWNVLDLIKLGWCQPRRFSWQELTRHR